MNAKQERIAERLIDESADRISALTARKDVLLGQLEEIEKEIQDALEQRSLFDETLKPKLKAKMEGKIG